jgi:proteic killer suppression protein
MVIMITTFRCKRTQKLFEKDIATGFLRSIEKLSKRKLAMLHFAVSLEDLKFPPGNRLERLKGNRKGQYSIRINDQYRICFRFVDANAYDVEITDYH